MAWASATRLLPGRERVTPRRREYCRESDWSATDFQSCLRSPPEQRRNDLGHRAAEPVVLIGVEMDNIEPGLWGHGRGIEELTRTFPRTPSEMGNGKFGGESSRLAPQCLKCRRPVNTIASPYSSAAAITS